MLGSYTGFDFAFPTIDLEIEVVSSTAIIGPFSDILYAVGGGMGVRLTCVYCQQKNTTTGNMHNRTLIDARR